MGMDITGRKPSLPEGEYFRANVWAWRPLHALCETVLGRRFEAWAYNNGAGFETQVECNELADKLEAYLAKFPHEGISLESDLRVDETGHFMPRGSTGGKSPYEISREHVREFITFLRMCGGFEIW